MQYYPSFLIENLLKYSLEKNIPKELYLAFVFSKNQFVMFDLQLFIYTELSWLFIHTCYKHARVSRMY